VQVIALSSNVTSLEIQRRFLKQCVNACWNGYLQAWAVTLVVLNLLDLLLTELEEESLS
jgi:hypothetical protein